MKLTSKTNPRQKGNYNLYDMLTEMYTFSQTELCGQYTPELGKLFNTTQTIVKGKNWKQISLEEIQKLAKPKIAKHQQQNLPSVPRKKFRLFGKTKDQVEYLQLQNSEMQTQLKSADVHNFRSQIQEPKLAAADLFKKRLMKIEHNISDEEEPENTLLKEQKSNREANNMSL